MPKRNETLKFTANFQGTARTSATITIVDKSYPSTYNTRWSSNQWGSDTIYETDEGRDIWFIIETDNVDNGTVLSVLTTSGPAANGVDANDFNNYQYQQNVTIWNNFAAVKISIRADQLTESREQFYCALLNTAGTVLSYTWMYINDTSKTPAPTYTVGWYSNSAGTTPINTINEGSTAWLIVRTTNVPDGTALSIRPDMRVSQDDFTDNALNREAVIQNNIARVSYPIKADNMTEGDETFTVQVYTSDDYYNAKAWAIITVIDTSVNTAYSGSATFKAGSYSTAPGVYQRGFIYYPSTSIIVGEEINDTIKFNNQLVDLTSCHILDVPASTSVSLFVDIGKENIIPGDMSFVVKLTNLTNNKTYTSPILEVFFVDDRWKTGWAIAVNDPAIASLLREIMADNTNVKVEFTYS